METIFWITALSIPILPNLWCIWHASRHVFPNPDEQKLWIRAGMFAPVIGGILYLTVGMRRAQKIREDSLPSFSDSDNGTGQDTPDQ